MLTFPQMRDGAVVQLPYSWRRRSRLLQQELAGGATYRRADVRLSQMEWRFRLRGLNDTERSALDQLFTETRGREGSFVFLDPSANLLAQSEAFTNSVWEKAPGLVLTSPVPGPEEGIAGTRISNPVGLAAAMSQQVPAPASFGYTASLWMRSPIPVTVEFGLGDPASPATKNAAVTAAWSRYSITGKSASGAESTDVWIRLQPGTEVEVAGWQLEPMAQASGYKKTDATSGVYTKCRFGMDQLDWTTDGFGSYSVEITILGI